MGDLRHDTAVEPLSVGLDQGPDPTLNPGQEPGLNPGLEPGLEPGLNPGRFRGEVSPDWDLWGPVGGYLAAIAVRAAGASTALARPASVACHYLAPARFGPVELTVTTGRRSRRAESLRVLMT
jgi:acyl-CoA thioesterase II